MVVKVRPNRPAVIVANPARVHVGKVWIDGHWQWNRKMQSYVWVKGHVVRGRRGHVWIAGKWNKRGQGWNYASGRWRRG